MKPMCCSMVFPSLIHRFLGGLPSDTLKEG
jgi:hypothetical protein